MYKRHIGATTGLHMPIDGIVACIQIAAHKPFRARRTAVVQNAGKRFIPCDQLIGQFRPELFRFVNGVQMRCCIGVVIISIDQNGFICSTRSDKRKMVGPCARSLRDRAVHYTKIIHTYFPLKRSSKAASLSADHNYCSPYCYIAVGILVTVFVWVCVRVCGRFVGGIAAKIVGATTTTELLQSL